MLKGKEDCQMNKGGKKGKKKKIKNTMHFGVHIAL